MLQMYYVANVLSSQQQQQQHRVEGSRVSSKARHRPIRRRKRGYILMTDQSDTGNPAVGLDTDTAELTVKTLSSHRVTLERIQFSRRFFADVECPCRAPL
eukprot:9188347-Pyramimonas_sp.AAC.1